MDAQRETAALGPEGRPTSPRLLKFSDDFSALCDVWEWHSIAAFLDMFVAAPVPEPIAK